VQEWIAAVGAKTAYIERLSVVKDFETSSSAN